MTLEHVALVWQSGVGFGFKAGLGVGLVAGLGLAWLWRWVRSQAGR
ncbi:hypothetical protein [Calidithermus timidus]|nr:hypothetical protein [Calidithermus timidus]